MFYSYDILQRHVGVFGSIWVAATNPSVLTRREILCVQISKSCAKIMDHILQRTARSHGNRFSLYLSSKLMFGVTFIFRKHHEILIDEILELERRLNMYRFKANIENEINLPPRTRPVLVDLQFSLNDIIDPFFGRMMLDLSEKYFLDRSFLAVPSPKTSSSSEEFSPQQLSFEQEGEGIRRADEDEILHTVPAADITMEDQPSFPPFEEPEPQLEDMQDIDMTEEIPGITDFPLEETSSTVPPEPITSLDDVPLPIQPITAESPKQMSPKEKTPAADRRPDLPTTPRIDRRKRPRRRISETPSEFDLGPLSPKRPRRKRSRRRLIFDNEIAIPRERIMSRTIDDIIRPMVHANPRPFIEPNVLFRQPGSKPMSNQLMNFWKRLVTREEPNDPARTFDLVSESSGEIIDSLSGSPPPETHDLSIPEIEAGRDIQSHLESDLQPSTESSSGIRIFEKSTPSIPSIHETPGPVRPTFIEEPEFDQEYEFIPAPEAENIESLQMVPEDLPRPRRGKRPCKLRTPSPSTSVVSTLTPPISPKPTLEEILYTVQDIFDREPRLMFLTFKELFPVDITPRVQAAVAFNNILRLHAAGFVTVRQRESYGEISIVLTE